MCRSMRCRVLCSGGLMLCDEEMVLCGLSCSMFVRRLCVLGTSLLSLPSSVEMYRLSFSLRRTRIIPLRFLGGGFGLAAEGRAFSQASVAFWNSTALLGSSILTETTSLSSIMKSFCGDRHNGPLHATVTYHTLWRPKQMYVQFSLTEHRTLQTFGWGQMLAYLTWSSSLKPSLTNMHFLFEMDSVQNVIWGGQMYKQEHLWTSFDPGKTWTTTNRQPPSLL